MISKVLLAVAVALVVAELRGWLRPAADFIVERASDRLRDPQAKERYVAEWKAELDSLDDRRLTQLVTAARMFHRAAATNAALGHNSSQNRRPSVIVRRARDVVVAGFLLLYAAPTLAVAALAVLLTSRGPLLERQRSLGRDDRPYQRLRFRTCMLVPWVLIEREEGVQYFYDTSVNWFDARIRAAIDDANRDLDNRTLTGVGRVLERFHLHELPVLWNVLRGEVSLREAFLIIQGSRPSQGERG